MLMRHSAERPNVVNVDQALDRGLFKDAQGYVKHDGFYRLTYPAGRVGFERITCMEFELSNLALKRSNLER